MSVAAALSETHKPNWNVLLLGGPSGVGKSSVSYTLARHFGVGICEIDDLYIVAKQISTPAQQPALHAWDATPHAQELPAERILELHIAACRAMAPSIDAVIANHVETNMPIVLEGDYVLPETMQNAVPEVTAVFLYEPDETQILRNFAQREPDAGEQVKRAQVSLLFGQWLKAECDRLGVVALPVRPWNSLLPRIVEAIS